MTGAGDDRVTDGAGVLPGAGDASGPGGAAPPPAAGDGPSAGTLPVADGRQTRAAVAGLLRGRRPLLAGTLLVLLAAAGAGLLGPLLLGVVVDRVVDGNGPGSITPLAAALLGIAVLQAALTVWGYALIPALGHPMLADLRERVVDHALRVPAERLERSGRGDLLSRVSDDVEAVADALEEVLPALGGALLTIVLSFVGLAALDWRLALAGLAAVPVQVLAVRWFLPRAQPIFAAERAVSGRRAQVLLEAVGGARTVRALSLGERERPRVETASQAGVDAMDDTMRVATSFGTRLNFAELVGTGAVLVAGFFLVRADAITIGATTAGALLFVRLFDQFGMVIGMLDTGQRALAALDRLVGVTTYEPPPPPPRLEAAAGAAAELRGVDHAYDGGPRVVTDVRLALAPGERVALVGASGAGKTTLAKILAGFHTPTAGDVAVARADHPRPVVLLTQEVRVFAGPLADDLRLVAPEATDADLRAALALAGAGEWLDALPDGLATTVGAGGHALTPAQAQQVALARLALADPPLAVLDEATAEAGSAGARVLEAAADRVLAGRTALVVAHRLTQAAAADRVVVMEAGRVVETGTHAELVAAGGAYATLWSAWSARRG